MFSTTTTPRETLLRNAQKYKTEDRFDLSTKDYITTTSVRCATGAKYKSQPEPIVPPDPYDITPAVLTMNPYNSLVLNSRTMFIADIDKGDPRLSWYATVEDEGRILANLKDLARFDAEDAWEAPIDVASWRLYRTHSGFRLICTSRLMCEHNMWFGVRLLRFLQADPRYIELCEKQRCFRARLTPKPWRGQEFCSSVCYLMEEIGSEVHPSIREQLRLHDELTMDIGEGLA
ncbi:MAG: hypothetical protein WD049_10000 [Candidatus Paceibacterota bacterium]